MNRLATLDPGLNRSGVAMFEDAKLVLAMTISVKAGKLNILQRAALMGEAVVFAVELPCDMKLVAEWPRVYSDRDGRLKYDKRDPNDLIPLAAVCGAVAPAFREVEIVAPGTWKGQVPKKTRRGVNPIKIRCLQRLSAAEKLVTGELAHDGWDAVGIGLWELGRFSGRVLHGASH